MTTRAQSHLQSLAQARSMRLPLILALTGSLLLLFGTGLLLLNQQGQSSNSARQQIARDVSETVDQLSVVVAPKNVVAQTIQKSDSNNGWAQSDELARLIAAGDVQVKELVESYGVFNFLSLAPDAADASEVNADWKMLREGLLSFNRSMQTAAQEVSQAETQQPESVAVPDAASSSVTEVPQSVQALASDFEQIRARIAEGTRAQSLIDLVNNSSGVWQQINNSNGIGLQALVSQQQIYADELLRLSMVGTDSSLFGYYTSNQIFQFVQRVKNIQLPVPALVDDSSVAKPEVVREKITTAPMVASNAFVTEALLQLQNSVAKFLGLASNTAKRRNSINWMALAALATALLFLFTSLWQIIRAVKGTRSQVIDEKLAVAEKNVPNASVTSPVSGTGSRLAKEAIAGQPQPGPTAVRPTVEHPADEPSRLSAMSVSDADQLIQDIDAIASGDLRYAVNVPGRGHGKLIAESANRTAAVLQNFVGMTRGVASRIDGVVEKHSRLDQALAENDIRRQSETAELSDSISGRSTLLDKQQLVLNAGKDLINEIEARSESAGNGVNEVSSSLARVSAQVEVSSGRMQRLLKTAGEVTESTQSLKNFAEQARLQALNVSLKMPEQNQQQIFEQEANGGYSNSDEHGLTAGLFEDIHQLTGKLVQLSSDTAALVTVLQSDIEETARSLKLSTEEINESARHTHTSSLIGKELDSYCIQLQRSIEDALANIESQKTELTQTARHIVRLDKTGNNTSELTLVLTQDVAELQTMASRLQESVAGFKMDGDTADDSAATDLDGSAPGAVRYSASEVTDTISDKTDDPASHSVKGEAPLA